MGKVFGHQRPVAFGIVGRPRLSPAGHHTRLKGMARLGESVRVRAPQRRIRREQPLPQQTGAPGALRTLVAHPDRQPLLHGAGPDAVLPPQLAKPTGGAVGLCVPRRHRCVEQLEFRYPVTGSEAQVEAAVGDQIHRCALLGDLRRVMQRCDDDRGSEPDALRAGGNGGGECQRRTEIVVFEEVVLGEPRRTRAEPLGLLARLQGESVKARRVLPPLRRVAQIEIDADFHGCISLCRSDADFKRGATADSG